MKYLKTYEQNTKKYYGMKKGDVVVFTDFKNQGKLKYGDKCIVHSVEAFFDHNQFGEDTIEKKKVDNDSDFITVVKNGELIKNNDESMLFAAYRFTPITKYNAEKYNL